MSTRAQLRQRVVDNLYSNEKQARPSLQRLNGTVANVTTDTTVTVDDGTMVSIGDIIEFEDGEQGYVFSVSTNDLGVVRQWNGTSSASHADNQFIKINPTHTIKQIDDALDEALRDMDSQGVYQLAAGTDITLVSGTDLYELTEEDVRNPDGVKAVFYQDGSNAQLVGIPFKVVWDTFNLELTLTVGVQLLHWGNNGAGDTLSVVYAQSLVGLIGSLTEASLEDAAVMFATGKLLQSQEGARIHDPGRYTDRTVQPGQHLRDGTFWMAQYQRAVWKAKSAIRLKERNLPRHPRQGSIDRFVR